ncbi:hypothetical protein Hjap01_04137 [Haloarcula japonica]
MSGLGSYATPSGRMFAAAWTGMALVMSLFVAIMTTFDIPVQATYVFAAGLTLRELVGLASWALQR